jgi:hypothetical protein
MQSTMNLLDKALAHQPAPYWHERLNLSRNALHNAKMRGHISPAIAGALAEELGQNVNEWIVIAALESERDSACKKRMLKRIAKMTSVYLCNRLLTHLPRSSALWMVSRIQATVTPNISASCA